MKYKGPDGRMVRAIFTTLVTAAISILTTTPLIVMSPFYRARRLEAWLATLWSRLVLWSAGVQLTIEGAEHVADGKPRIYMANHQSALDIPILFYGLGGKVRFMAKKALFRIPFFGWYLSLYDYIPIDRSNPRATRDTLSKMLKLLHEKPCSFIVFPEGTRSVDGRLLPFRRGAMKIGQRSGFDIVPVAIDGSVKVCDRNRIQCRPGPVRLVFSKPIRAEEVANMTQTEIHDCVRQAIAGNLGQPDDTSVAELIPTVVAEGV